MERFRNPQASTSQAHSEVVPLAELRDKIKAIWSLEEIKAARILFERNHLPALESLLKDQTKKYLDILKANKII